MGRGIALELAREGYDVAFSYFPDFQNDEAAVKNTQKLPEDSDIPGKGWI